jgi:hypothetical protein
MAHVEAEEFGIEAHAAAFSVQHLAFFIPRPAITMRVPSRAKASAVARPMPVTPRP